MQPGMSEGFNTVTLLGNIGNDPELKMTSSGAVLKVRLATEHSWVDKESNKKQSRTEWHTVTIFGRRGEALSKLLVKGQQIFVQGRIQTSSYEKDGQRRYKTEIIATDVRFGSSPRANGSLPHIAEAPGSLMDTAPF